MGGWREAVRRAEDGCMDVREAGGGWGSEAGCARPEHDETAHTYVAQSGREAAR